MSYRIVFAIVAGLFGLLIYFGLPRHFCDEDGIVNPPGNFQRVRIEEYSDEDPFFQWWYFTIKDLKKNRYFAFDYSISDCAKAFQNEGVYLMFSMVDQLSGQRFHKYEKHPINAFSFSNFFDIKVGLGPSPEYEIQVIDEDTYRLKGKMKDPSKLWYADGCYPEMPIEWDLTIYRIYGWYGQHDFEENLQDLGVISWNTFAHNAEVEGTIIIGDSTYSFQRNENFRAYCDVNWGLDFPSGQPNIEHPWGWYYAGKANPDPQKDISIIAGMGRYDTGFPLGTCLGKFADIRLDSSTHIGIRQNKVWSERLTLIETTNDESVKQFEIERSNWSVYEDSVGTAWIPLDQKVIMETEHYLVVLNFQSELSDYNRLLFPHENYIFSDFEGLGVDCHVTISYRRVHYPNWDLFQIFPITKYDVIVDFWTDDGGIEYGYKMEESPILKVNEPK